MRNHQQKSKYHLFIPFNFVIFSLMFLYLVLFLHLVLILFELQGTPQTKYFTIYLEEEDKNILNLAKISLKCKSLLKYFSLNKKINLGL